MIQAFCAHDDLLALTSIDKTAFATRFCNPRLQKLCFKTVNDTEQFLSYCQALQEKETEEQILQEVNALTLTISAQFTAEQYDLLFTYLSGIQHLTIYSEKGNYSNLSASFKAAQRLNLHHLAAIKPDNRDSDKVKKPLPNELWQFTALETLTIRGFKNVTSIEDIGQLKALKSLTLDTMPLLKALPASLGQLDKLEALTLKYLISIAVFPEEIGQLKALKSLTLEGMYSISKLPASLGQLDKLETLTLAQLPFLKTLCEEIVQLTALKSLELNYLGKLQALPASIGQLDNLEALTLESLNGITILPEEIGHIRALKIVKLIDMEHLTIIPKKLAQIVVVSKGPVFQIWSQYVSGQDINLNPIRSVHS
jgi:Leucine-rich repeat (LRR) protein